MAASRKVSDEILMSFMKEIRKDVKEIKSSVADNAKNIAVVATDLKSHKKSRLKDNVYIAIITIIISVSCLLMGYIWGREINKKENVKQEIRKEEPTRGN